VLFFFKHILYFHLHGEHHLSLLWEAWMLGKDTKQRCETTSHVASITVRRGLRRAVKWRAG